MKIGIDLIIRHLYKKIEEGEYVNGLISYSKRPRTYKLITNVALSLGAYQEKVVKDWNCALRINLWFFLLRFTWIKVNGQKYESIAGRCVSGGNKIVENCKGTCSIEPKPHCHNKDGSITFLETPMKITYNIK